ncbi:MAG: hypothetical protein H6741_10385 [Alphaproteobacteria bacterium]|nr:hypothetical protein [Alphaproteobacteria bacterium]
MRLLALALLLLTPACDATKREARLETRAVRRESRQLSEIAELYWRALRWQDIGVVAGFIEDGDRRLRWMNEAAQELGAYRYRSVEVMRVEIGPALEADPEGHLREARVLVQVQGYRVDEQVIRQELLVQEWYRSGAGWFVVPGFETGSAVE